MNFDKYVNRALWARYHARNNNKRPPAQALRFATSSEIIFMKIITSVVVKLINYTNYASESYVIKSMILED